MLRLNGSEMQTLNASSINKIFSIRTMYLAMRNGKILILNPYSLLTAYSSLFTKNLFAAINEPASIQNSRINFT